MRSSFSVSEDKWKSKVVPTPIDVDRTPVAQDVWCYSAKEKAFTWHVVLNHDANGYVDRVQCKTSKSIHKYKRQNKETASPLKNAPKRIVSKRTSPASAAAKSANLEEIWFEGIKAWGNKVVKAYAADTTFHVKEVIDHPTFGKGVIQARRDNKIDILFRTGMKTLLSPLK